VIYGPSGAGKSMLLQILAGLITPDYGRVSFADERIFDSREGVDVPARARRFGYLFQDYALFPQLSVRQNVAFALSEGWRNPPPPGPATPRSPAGSRPSSSMPSPISVPMSCRAVSVNAPRSRARWSINRAHCCWTNLSRRSIRSCARACATRWISC
jgi:ABC-type sugar transport system ATPase subunit